MSLTSLANAPLLSNPSSDTSSSLPRSRSLPLTKFKEDQAAIDALFQEDPGLQEDKPLLDGKSIPPSTEPSPSAKKFEMKSSHGEAVSLPALLLASQQTSDASKKRQPKQSDNLFSKTRDASDVLAGFLADNTIETNIIKQSLPQEVNKDQREDFNSKWNSHSPQPFGRLPTLPFSPRLALGSLERPTSPEKTSNSLTFQKQDQNWDTKEDVLSLLPDDLHRTSNSRSNDLSFATTTSCKNVDKDNLDFGGYQPSCLSMPASKSGVQRRHLTSFFPSLETFDEKETKIAEEKQGKALYPSTKAYNPSQPSGIVVDNLSHPPRVMLDNPSHQVEMLKKMHTLELERMEKQLRMEVCENSWSHVDKRELVAEKKGAMESISQLLIKAEEWSAKIDELHKSTVGGKKTPPTERLDWIASIESAVSDHESSLHVMEKRSTEVCCQLEKVALILENTRKDMARLQKQEDQHISSSHDQPQGNQDKKDLELERETLLCMREHVSQADATLRKQLHEHALHMQTEAEEMVRQKKELEHAKNIAAEIAVEVENSQRELGLYKRTWNKTTAKVQAKKPHLEDDLVATHGAPTRLPEVGSELPQYSCSSYELDRRPYSSGDVHINSLYTMDGLETMKSLGSAGGAAMMQDVQEGMFYIRAQEDFLIQAEKALESMCFNDLCVPLADFGG